MCENEVSPVEKKSSLTKKARTRTLKFIYVPAVHCSVEVRKV